MELLKRIQRRIMEIYRIPLSRYLRGIAKNSRIGEIPNISAESSRKVLAKSLGRAIRNRDENRNALENFIAIFVARRITNQRKRERVRETKQTEKQGIERYFEISNRGTELRGINECVDEARKQKTRSNKHMHK